MKDDYSTNSHYLTYLLLFTRKVGRMYFLNMGVKGLSYEKPTSSYCVMLHNFCMMRLQWKYFEMIILGGKS